MLCTLPCGVIGSTSGSNPLSPGSNPGGVTSTAGTRKSMVTIIAAFSDANAVMAEKVFGSGDEKFIFGDIASFRNFIKERMWELPENGYDEVLAKYFMNGWKAGIVQYQSAADMREQFPINMFDLSEMAILSIR